MEKYGNLSDEEIEQRIASLEAEISEKKQQIQESQKRVAQSRNELLDVFGEVAGDKGTAMNMIVDMYRNTEFEIGTKEYHDQRAEILWTRGERNEALEHYDKALNKSRETAFSEDDAITLMNRGNLQLELGNFDECILDLERAAEINPTLPTWNAQFLKLYGPEDREKLRLSILANYDTEK